MFLSVEDIESLESEKFISHDDFIRDFKVYPEKGDLLMTRIGSIGITNIVETTYPIAYYVSLALLKKKELDSFFLKQCISSTTVVKELWKRTLHIAFPIKINKNEIGNICIPYPINSIEQKRIGELFRQLSINITLHQREQNRSII